MKKKYASLVLAAMLTLSATGLANATAISYIATDLADVTPGEDLWQYTYIVTGDSFAANTGFTIEFETDLFVLSESQQASPNADWDVITKESPFYTSGEVYVYDAYALKNGASLANQFSVSFVWLGGAEGPGIQFFKVYDEYTVLQDGMTAPVPEPGTMLLLGTGLAVVSAVGRRSKN